MHFVAMLGLQLPILFYYDALLTLASALVAILIAGVALLILHFRPRNLRNITASGFILGLGIPAMHYLGMQGIQLCRVSYSPLGVFVAISVSILLCIGAIWVTYGNRSRLNIVLGTLCLGSSVFTVHFIAIAGTRFWEVTGVAITRQLVSNEMLAIIVLLISFVICAALLLSGITFFPSSDELQTAQAKSESHERGVPEEAQQAAAVSGQVPYEKDGNTHFVDYTAIAVVRAEGHYTILYVDDQELFCPWSISEVESRLPAPILVRSHRSYLINPAMVKGFERKKDNAVCTFEQLDERLTVPVSRSRLAHVREVLGV